MAAGLLPIPAACIFFTSVQTHWAQFIIFAEEKPTLNPSRREGSYIGFCCPLIMGV